MVTYPLCVLVVLQFYLFTIIFAAQENFVIGCGRVMMSTSRYSNPERGASRLRVHSPEHHNLRCGLSIVFCITGSKILLSTTGFIIRIQHNVILSSNWSPINLQKVFLHTTTSIRKYSTFTNNYLFILVNRFPHKKLV